jgi:hypothetical protein
MAKYLILGITLLVCATDTSTRIAAESPSQNACHKYLSSMASEAKLGEELFWEFAVVGDAASNGLLSYSFLSGPDRQPTAMALLGAPVDGKGCNAAQVAVNYDARSCEVVRKELSDLRIDFSSENALVLSGSPLNPTNVTLLRGGAGCVLVVQHARSMSKP